MKPITPNVTPNAKKTLAELGTELKAATTAEGLLPARRIPPLDTWHPKHCGYIDITIKANGEWWHEGTKVTRQSLADLFSSVLWSEVGADNRVDYFLKTPAEKLSITVEDAPLLITDVQTIADPNAPYPWLCFYTPQGDRVKADAAHPLRFGLPFANTAPASQERLYILVRQIGDAPLYGLIHRNVWFHLIELGELHEAEGETVLTLYSGDERFDLAVPNLPEENQ